MSISCPICVKKVLDSEEGVQCDEICQRWFHRECLKMSKSEYQHISNSNDVKWYCTRTDCFNLTSQPQNQLLDQLKILTNQISDLTGKVNSLTSLPSKLDSLINDVDNVNKNLLSLDKRVSENESRIKVLEEQMACSNTSQSVNDPEATIAEIHDRARRSKNVMMFNLNESLDKNLNSKKEHDRKLVNNLIQAFAPNIRLESIRLFRVGKGSNNTRPLKLIFVNESDAINFITGFSTDSAAKLDQCYENVKVSRDRTPRELDHLKSLRKELDRRTMGGEKDLRIRYLSGVPQIVKNQKN